MKEFLVPVFLRHVSYVFCTYDFHHLPSDVQELGVNQSCVGKIHVEVRDSVRRLDIALVPVVGNPLVPLFDLVVTRSASDSEPGGKGVVAQVSNWSVATVIGHEAVDESVGCRLYQDTSERSVEEVRVIGNLRVEALGAERSKGVEVDFTTRRHVDQLLVLLDDKLPVVADLVEVSTCRGCIRLVPERY